MRIRGVVVSKATSEPVGNVRVTIRVGGQEVAAHSDPAGEFEWRDDRSHVGETVELEVRGPGFLPWETSREVKGDETVFEIRLDPSGAGPVPPPEPVRDDPVEVATQRADESPSIPRAWLVVTAVVALGAVLALAFVAVRSDRGVPVATRVPAELQAVPSTRVEVLSMQPPSPARVRLGERVTVRYSWATRETDGLRIVIEPMTGERPAPGAVVGESPVVTGPRGTGTTVFTLRSAGGVTVDRLRIRAFSQRRREVVHESFVRAQYAFR